VSLFIYRCVVIDGLIYIASKVCLISSYWNPCVEHQLPQCTKFPFGTTKSVPLNTQSANFLSSPDTCIHDLVIQISCSAKLVESQNKSFVPINDHLFVVKCQLSKLLLPRWVNTSTYILNKMINEETRAPAVKLIRLGYHTHLTQNISHICQFVCMHTQIHILRYILIL
jgi:hypothetical protein